jgi:hypothetical protein
MLDADFSLLRIRDKTIVGSEDAINKIEAPNSAAYTS